MLLWSNFILWIAVVLERGLSETLCTKNSIRDLIEYFPYDSFPNKWLLHQVWRNMISSFEYSVLNYCQTILTILRCMSKLLFLLICWWCSLAWVCKICWTMHWSCCTSLGRNYLVWVVFCGDIWLVWINCCRWTIVRDTSWWINKSHNSLLIWTCYNILLIS